MRHLEPDTEVNVAVSLILGADADLPWSTDARGRPVMVDWLRKHGVSAASPLPLDLCRAVMWRWLEEQGGYAFHRSGGTGAFVLMANSMPVSAEAAEWENALARLVLRVMEPHAWHEAVLGLEMADRAAALAGGADD